MRRAEITPISTRAINNLGGRLTRLVEIIKIDGDKALMRLPSNKIQPNKCQWYIEGKDFTIRSITNA